MSYPEKLRDIVTHSSAEKDLTQALVHALEHHGGSERHFTKLLADAREENTFLAELAKSLIGAPWRLTQEPFKLLTHTEDIGKRAERMITRSSNIVCHNANETSWESLDPVSGPHYYKLMHMTGDPSYEEVLALHEFQEGICHADFRALVAFQQKLEKDAEGEDFCGITVCALGARGRYNIDDPYGFPFLTGPSLSICMNTAIGDSQFPFPKSKSFALVRLKD
jgi:hypothetical protein